MELLPEDEEDEDLRRRFKKKKKEVQEEEEHSSRRREGKKEHSRAEGRKARVAALQSRDKAPTSPLGVMEVRNKSGAGSGAPRQPLHHPGGVFAFPLRPLVLLLSPRDSHTFRLPQTNDSSMEPPCVPV